MVSIFPNEMTWAGAADTEIVIEAKQVEWGSFEDKLGIPMQPAKVDPAKDSGLVSVDGAAFLRASALALAAVASGLY